MADQLKENGGIYEVQEEILNAKVIDLLEEKANVTEIDPKQDSNQSPPPKKEDCCDENGGCCD